MPKTECSAPTDVPREQPADVHVDPAVLGPERMIARVASKLRFIGWSLTRRIVWDTLHLRSDGAFSITER